MSLAQISATSVLCQLLEREKPEILEQFELVVNTVSMEEAVQQQADITPADVGEVSES